MADDGEGMENACPEAERDRRTITRADARAIAIALLKEATEQLYSATGRGIISTFKTLFWPIVIAGILYVVALSGKPFAIGHTQ